jgi:NAD(P)-dependent dehydrogenase (short-subunit alcohol dehydrogenase family)
VGRRAKAYWGPYAVSKAALEMLVRTYAAEVQNMNVRANLFNPGAVRTKMRAKAMPGEDPATLPKPRDVAPAFLELVSPELTHNGMIYDWPSKSWVDPATGQSM